MRLAPWDHTQDHSGFLKLCRDEGLHLGICDFLGCGVTGNLALSEFCTKKGPLIPDAVWNSIAAHFSQFRYVIPSFDLGAFLSEDARACLGLLNFGRFGVEPSGCGLCHKMLEDCVLWRTTEGCVATIPEVLAEGAQMW